MPLVFQAFDWEQRHLRWLDHGIGNDRGPRPAGWESPARSGWRCCRSAATTSAIIRHWLETGKRLTNPPLIFHVNWFRNLRMENFCARVWRQHAGVEVDHRSLRRAPSRH